jgi:tetratricopeptide (TPR) repeat protein
MDPSIRFANERTAIALLNAGNPAGAEARLRTMLADDPNDADTLALMAHCRLRLQDRKGALKRARAAAAINPDSWLVRRALLSALMANGRHKEAEPIAEGLAADAPDDSAVLFDLAVTRLSRYQYREAAELFDQAEANATGDAYDLLTIAYQRLHQWRFAEAEQLAAPMKRTPPRSKRCAWRPTTNPPCA